MRFLVKMSYLFTEIVDSGLFEDDEEVNQPEPPPPGVDMEDLLAEGNFPNHLIEIIRKIPGN